MILSPLQIIFLLIIILYLIQLLFTFTGILLPSEKIEKNDHPAISIIVAARNEENNLPVLIESLNRLHYPKEKMEIIFVDDRSTDSTKEILLQYQANHSNVKTIKIDTASEQWTGKGNALVQGVGQSKGEILFFTDADCIVPETWITETLNQLKKGAGMVGGALILDHFKNTTLSKLQTLDWLYLTIFGSSWARFKHPISIWGNNFAIKRSVYEEAGGFESAGKHILEDFQLLQNVFLKTDVKISLHIDQKNAVDTQAEDSFKGFFEQRKRWTIGARSHGILAYCMSAITGLFTLTIPLSFIFQWYIGGIAALAIQILSDLLLFWPPLKKLQKLNLIVYYPIYKLWFWGYILLLIPHFIGSKDVTWKSQKYQIS